MRLIKFAIFLIFISPLICSGQQGDTEAGNKPQSTAKAEVQTIHIFGINSMKYVVKKETEAVRTGDKIKASNGEKYVHLESINVSPGEKINIKLTSIGELPAASMSHNWILLKEGIDPSAFTKTAMQAKDSGYIPKKHQEDIIAHTSLAAGGDTVEVTFTVPEKKGKYDYLCSFPGHFQGGMKGTLIVD